MSGNPARAPEPAGKRFVVVIGQITGARWQRNIADGGQVDRATA
jgi:hypothetical protein